MTRIPLTLVNAAAGTTRQDVYGYDAEGRLDRIQSPEGVICYGYNALGQKTGMWTEKSATDATVFSAATYGYDELGCLKSVTQTKLNGQAVSLSTTYRYDAVGNLATTTLPNGTVTSDHYDDLNRLDLETITQGTQTLASYDYHLLADGNRDYVIETDSLGGQTRVDWTYDVDGRLTRETRDEGNDGVQNGGDYTDTYTLDLVGNRLEKAHDAVGTANDETTTDAYNERDQLVSEDSTNNAHDASYTYDNNGSQITKTENGVTITYQWDLQNHMASIDNTTDGTADVTYGYNSDGIRVAESANGVTTYYLNDPQNPTGYAKAVEERTDTDADGKADAPATSYLLGLEVIGQYQGTTLNYLLHDGHGSTRLLTDALGNPVESYHYDAFGTLLCFTGTPKTNWQFGGDGLWDPNSLFTYHLARFRDGDRFVSYDSFEADPTSPASLHKYLYCSSNPVQAWDPSGQSLLGDVLCSVGWMSVGAALLGSVFSVAREGSLAAFAPDASVLGISVTATPTAQTVLTAASMISAALYRPELVSSTAARLFTSIIFTSGLLNTPKFSVPLVTGVATGVGLGVTVGVELVNTANTLESGLFVYVGGAFVANTHGASGIGGFFYDGVDWGLKRLDDYKGVFFSVGVAGAAGVFGAGVSAFWDPDFTQHGVVSGLSFGTPASGFGGSLSVADYYGPYAVRHGENAVMPYLLAAWPPPYGLMLAAKAHMSARD